MPLQNRINTGAVIASFLWLTAASTAVADESLLGSVLDCRALPSAEERLQCYDGAVDDYAARGAATPAAEPPEAAEGGRSDAVLAEAAESAPSGAVLAAAERARSEGSPAEVAEKYAEDVEEFGLPIDSRTSIDRIEATIAGLSVSASGKIIVTLDNDQVWRQTTSSNLRLSEGDEVTIRRRSLGSHTISVTGNKRTMKVKRVK